MISQLKNIADKDPDEARKLLCGHPQLPEAILHLMSKLDMIKTPIETSPHLINAPPPPPNKPPMSQPPPPPLSTRADPRALADPRAGLSDPRTARADPRQSRDPRAAMQLQQKQQSLPPPPITSIPPPPIVRPPQFVQMNLDPALIQQVMSLTPQQIGLLPVDKQQSILALRQQITGGMG